MLSEDRIVAFLNGRIRDYTGVGNNDGKLFGLELELEGRGVALENVPSKNWRRVADGSLRGESIEYVFAQPCEFDEGVSRVKKLFSLLEKHKVGLKNSYRTSTHVHLNFADKTIKQLINFFLLHTVFEELFEHYCGEDRSGNLFCLSARANEEVIRFLDLAVFHNNSLREFNNDRRYLAANICSINKFGSMEIRTMRGADNPDMVIDWMHILNQLYEYVLSKDAEPPARIAENLSHMGIDRFMAQYFDSPSIDKLMASWPKAKDLGASFLEGVRLIQMFAYRLDEYWNREPVVSVAKKTKVDPFGRDIPQDRIFVPALGTISVPHRDNTENGQIVILSRRINAQFERADNCWWEINNTTGRRIRPCRWTVYRGLRLIPNGLGEDGEANFRYYDTNGWPDNDRDDDDDIPEDWEE